MPPYTERTAKKALELSAPSSPGSAIVTALQQLPSAGSLCRLCEQLQSPPRYFSLYHNVTCVCALETLRRRSHAVQIKKIMILLHTVTQTLIQLLAVGTRHPGSLVTTVNAADYVPHNSTKALL
eukprot:3674045-Rhodomonas_salina.2